jgi:hypothetical protein
MLLIIPPTIDIDNTVTQVKQEILHEQSLSSTCFERAYQTIPEDFDFSLWHKNSIFSTDINIENSEMQDNSTWEENYLNEYDLVTNVIFNKSFKVKGKIKTVTKYKPKIIID